MLLTWKEKKKGQLVLQCHFKSFLLEENVCILWGKKQETRNQEEKK